MDRESVTRGVTDALWGILLGALLTIGLIYGIDHDPDLQPTPPAPTVIHEDDPRWDCTTMGNRICGAP